MINTPKDSNLTTEDITRMVQEKTPFNPDLGSLSGGGNNPHRAVSSKSLHNLEKMDFWKSQNEAVQISSRDIKLSDVYARKSDGTYVAKYNDIVGAEGNENREALNQSGWEQSFNGIGKFLGKTVVYAADATLGTLSGALNGIKQGSWEAVWDNPFSVAMDDLNVEMDNGLPNYYSDYQKNMSIWESLGTTNFWANDVAGGLAFVAGTLLGEGAITLATGGASLATALPRLGLRVGGKKAAKSLTKQALKHGDDIAKSKARSIYKQTVLGKAGKTVDTGLFAFRSSNFEAGMESRHNYKESIETYIRSYKAEHGKQPSVDELADFSKQATHAANGLYAANLAILAPSNLLMFGKSLGIGTRTSKKFNTFKNRSLFGSGTKTSIKEGKLVAEAVKGSKIQRNLNRGQRLLGKASVEGIYEEGFQGVAGKTMQNYLEAKYDPEKMALNMGFWESLSDGFHEQYTTQEGWKEMFIGMIIGGMGGQAVSSPKSLIKNVANNFTLNDQTKENEAAATTMNSAYADVMKRFDSSTGLMSSIEKQTKNSEGVKIGEVDLNKAVENETQANFHYIKTMGALKLDTEIAEDYNFHVDNMEISPEVQRATGLDSETDINEYKEGLKSKFAAQLKRTRKAQEAVRALGIAEDITVGNRTEVEDSLAYTIYMGESSLGMANAAVEQIAEIFGMEDVGGALTYMANLTDEDSKLIDRIKANEAKIDNNNRKAELLAVKAQERKDHLANKANRRGANSTEGFINKLRGQETTTNENTLAIAKENQDLQVETEGLKAILDKKHKASTFNLGEDFSISEAGASYIIDDVLAKVETMEELIADLRAAGKGNDARQLERMLADFRHHNENHNNFQDLYNQMLDPKFFKSKNGRSMMGKVIGDKYEMSEDFEKLVEKHSERIAKSLNRQGVVVAEEDVAAHVREMMDSNSLISEREKFRNEQIIRIMLMQSSILDAQVQAEEIRVEDVESTQEDDSGLGIADEIATIIQREDAPGTNKEQLDEIINVMLNDINSLLPSTEINEGEITAIQEEYNVTIAKNEEGVYSVAETKDNKVSKADEAKAAIKLLKKSKEVDNLIITPAHLRRIDALATKIVTGELTPEEAVEFEELRRQFDNWTLVDGMSAEVSSGNEQSLEKVRLSDLIKLRAQYKTLEIASESDVYELQDFDGITLDEFKNRTDAQYYNILQSYFAATVIKDDKSGKISIQNITLNGLLEQIGAEQLVEDSKPNKTYLINIAGEKVEVETNAKGNLLFEESDIELLNAGTNLVIKQFDNDSKTKYSVLLIDRNGKLEKVDSNYDLAKTQNDEVIYKLSKGDSLELAIEPNDTYNNELVDASTYSSKLAAESTKIDKKIAAKEKKSPNEDFTTLRAELNATALAKITEEFVNEAADKIRIRVRDKDKNDVGVLKATSDPSTTNANDLQFVEMRRKIARDYFLNFIGRTNTVITVEEYKPTVSNVFMGHPYYLYNNEGDSLSTKFVKFGDKQSEEKDNETESTENVVDIGFLQDGQLTLRKNGTKTLTEKGDVDTTFLNKLGKNKSKTPVIVIDHHGQKIAFPVKLRKREMSVPIDQVKSIFESNVAAIDKIQAINDILAEYGIDPNIPGQSFKYFSSNNNNLSEDQLNKIIALLENNDYVYSQERWLGDMDMGEVLKSDALVNIDMNNRFHSPKVVIDYNIAPIQGSSVQPSVKQKANSAAKVTKPSSQGVMAASIAKNKC